MKQKAQLLLERADRTRVSEGQQIIFVLCERVYTTYY